MSSSYKSLKCDSCAGSLRYDPKKKVWVCNYCGTEIRREEEYDGLYTIKNVAKQAIRDVAYGNLDSAQKNLLECEKIDDRYVGTIIADIVLKFIRLQTPGSCDPGEARNLMAMLKRRYYALMELDDDISPAEEAFYEACAGENDVFGILVIVFDSLGGQGRVHRDFAESLLDAKEIYSVSLNSRLLTYAMKYGKQDLIDTVFENTNNINCSDCLKILLDTYPDSEKKRAHIRKLFPRVDFAPDDGRKFDSYLEQTGDGAETKAEVYCLAAKHGVLPSVDSMTAHIIAGAEDDTELVGRVIEAFVSTKPKDAELYILIEKIYVSTAGVLGIAEMDMIEKSGLFVQVPVKSVRFMLKRTDLTQEERKRLLAFAESGKTDAKANDQIISDYLMNAKEPPEVRMDMISALLTYTDTVSAATVKSYVLQCALDGAKKPDMLQLFLQLGLNMSFFRELLSDYTKTHIDPREVQTRVIALLGGEGLAADCSTLLEMACRDDPEHAAETYEFISTSITNGTRISADALDTYLKKVVPTKYSANLMNLLSGEAPRISDDAIARYVLWAKHDSVTKASNARFLAGCNPKPFGSTDCTAMVNGSKLRGNLMQLYILRADDPAQLMDSIISDMRTAGTRLNGSISVNGTEMKFKKYCTDNRAQLSETTLAFLNAFGVFKPFF